MKRKVYYLVKGASAKLGGYPQLLKNLIELHKVPHAQTEDGRILLDDEGLNLLRPLVQEHLNRPRVSKPSAAVSA